MLNVQKIINVNKRIYCEKTYKQTLIVNADISPRFINYVGLPVVNIFTVRASSKFQFIGAVASIIHFQTVCKIYKAWLLIVCFVSPQLTFSTFHVRFIKNSQR